MKLTRIAPLAALVAATLAWSSCSSNKEEQTDQTLPDDATTEQLREALANQDSLLMLINDLNDGMSQIRQLENILSTSSDLNAETADRRTEIRDNMQAIQVTLQERRQRLAELEKKLKASNSDNALLRKTIETLRQQIADQEGTIETLRIELANANIKVERLTANVDSLNTTVATTTTERDAAQAQAAQLTQEVNTVFYAIGSKKELKEHDLIETGFLKRTKVMPSDFQQGFFTRADRRTLSVIDLHSPKAKILTSQPKDSYEITTGANGNKMLQITDPARFWQQSKYLVIQVD